MTENGYTHCRGLEIISHHEMSKRLKWVYPFLVMEWVSHSQCVLQLMMIYYVETPEISVSILSDRVGKTKGSSSNYSKRSHWWSWNRHNQKIEKKRKKFFIFSISTTNKYIPIICHCRSSQFAFCHCKPTDYPWNVYQDTWKYWKIKFCHTSKIHSNY